MLKGPSQISSSTQWIVEARCPVNELRSTAAADAIAIGERVRIRIGHRCGADRRQLSGVIQTSHFKDDRTVFVL
jgi:hypothetical protein